MPNIDLSSPAAFRRNWLIDVATGDGAQRLSAVADPWQIADFEALDAGWCQAIGIDLPPTSTTTSTDALPIITRGYLERPRGHSKTSDLAVSSSHALLAAKRQILIIWAAADKDQGKLGRDAMARQISLNGVQDVLDVQAHRVVNVRTGSTLEVISADAATSYGLTPDVILCDELTHWKSEDLWHSLASAAIKKKNCLLVVISNAGFGMGESWQWTVREAARESADWYFSRIDGPQASWISPQRLVELQKLLPSKAFARLILNLWTADTGDALEMTAIEAAMTRTGPTPHMTPEWQAAVGSLDLGLKRDHSALVVVGVNVSRGRLDLLHLQNWAPPGMGKTLEIEPIKQAVIEAHWRYGLNFLCYDPWQCEYLAEQVRAAGIPTIAVPATGANLNQIATQLLYVFNNKLLGLWREPSLVRDLMRLTIVEGVGGFKLKATRDEFGHADRAIALAQCLPTCVMLQAELAKGIEHHRPRPELEHDRILAEWREEKRRREPPSMAEMIRSSGGGIAIGPDGSARRVSGDLAADVWAHLQPAPPGAQRINMGHAD